MAAYRIFIKQSAAHELEGLAKKDLAKVLARIEALGDNPRPEVAEKLVGVELWRIRQGAYRIVYSIEDDFLTVWIVKVGHRREVPEEPVAEEHRQLMDRRAFMKLPVEERRRILEEQARTLQKHYAELTEHEEPGGGDFFDY